MPFIDIDGLVRNDDNSLRAPFVDRVLLAEKESFGETLICLRLYEANGLPFGQLSQDAPKIPEHLCHQVSMNAGTLRYLARQLTEWADGLDSAGTALL